jgi:hypothetical protein
VRGAALSCEFSKRTRGFQDLRGFTEQKKHADSKDSRGFQNTSPDLPA